MKNGIIGLLLGGAIGIAVGSSLVWWFLDDVGYEAREKLFRGLKN